MHASTVNLTLDLEFESDRRNNCIIYIYNSVLTHRHIHINSSASTPPNATKIAEMKDSHHGQVAKKNYPKSSDRVII